jgi:hypothetical protein
MAITPVSHEVSEPHDLETGQAILFIPTSNPPRGRSRWGVYRESGLVHGGKAAVREHGISGSRDVPRRNILAPPKPSRLVFAHEAGVADCVDGQDRGEFSGSIQEMKAFDERCYFTPLGGRFGRIASRRRRTLPEPNYE